MRQPIPVNDLALASALAAYGFPLFEHEDDSPPFVKLTTKHGKSTIFFFDHESSEGELTKDYIDAWHDETWVDNNQDNPFSYIIVAFKNRNSLLDMVKQSASIIVLEKGNKFTMISSDLPEAMKNKVLERL